MIVLQKLEDATLVDSAATASQATSDAAIVTDAGVDADVRVVVPVSREHHLGSNVGLRDQFCDRLTAERGKRATRDAGEVAGLLLSLNLLIHLQCEFHLVTNPVGRSKLCREYLR